MNRKILQLAIPSIVSNITVPLLGLVDVAIVGHLGSASYIGAIAVGGMLFNMIYWIFGFLRMGTSGMTAQAYGKRDLTEVVRTLLRAVGVGLLISLGLWILQSPILRGAFVLIDATEEVKRWASLYFNICIWGAPAVLGLYGFAGWFIGMQNSRFPMFIAITQNIVNIVASLCFVAQIAMGADYNQTVKAIAEAEAYPGPSLVIGYAPCINHGIKGGMKIAQTEEKKAVTSGYWNLFRFNPTLAAEGKNPFHLDSKAPTTEYEDFIMGEGRYNALSRQNPERAKALFEEAKANAEAKYNRLKEMSDK